MNRRTFFRNTALGAGSALLSSSLLRADEQEKLAAKAPAGPVIGRTLGRTGIKIPVVSMGVMNADNPELLRQAFQTGIRYFDTAWYYQRGNNEKMVGRVLGEVSPRREDFVVSTKILMRSGPKGDEAKQYFLARFDESQQRLRMDYVDILFYHSAERKDEAVAPYIIEAMEELKKSGRIRFTGVSTHAYWPDLLPQIVERGYHDVAMLSFNYSMASTPAFLEAASKATAKGMGLIAMKTQCRQSWYKKNIPAEMQHFYEGAVMNGALLKWVLRHEVFATAVPGFTTFQQLDEDFEVARNLDFTPAEAKFLADRNVKVAMESTCQTCGRCLPSCLKGADVPNLMRTHMYAFSYGNIQHARATLDDIPAGRGLAACRECTTCSARCVRQVDIAGRLEELRGVYC